MRHIFCVEAAIKLGKGVLGMAAASGGFYASMLPTIEAWLRIISLLVGITVGVATFVSIIKPKQKKPKQKHPHERPD